MQKENIKDELNIMTSLYEKAQDEINNCEYQMMLLNQECDEILECLNAKTDENNKLNSELNAVKMKFTKTTHRLELCLQKLEDFHPKNVEKKLLDTVRS